MVLTSCGNEVYGGETRCEVGVLAKITECTDLTQGLLRVAVPDRRDGLPGHRRAAPQHRRPGDGVIRMGHRRLWRGTARLICAT